MPRSIPAAVKMPRETELILLAATPEHDSFLGRDINLALNFEDASSPLKVINGLQRTTIMQKRNRRSGVRMACI